MNLLAKSSLVMVHWSELSGLRYLDLPCSIPRVFLSAFLLFSTSRLADCLGNEHSSAEEVMEAGPQHDNHVRMPLDISQ